MANTVSGPRVPGSAHIPFNPQNAFGKTPTVRTKDGKIIDWKSPIREPLFQVMVEDETKGLIAVSPKMRHDVIADLASLTNIAIKSGRISGWTNPHIVAC